MVSFFSLTFCHPNSPSNHSQLCYGFFLLSHSDPCFTFLYLRCIHSVTSHVRDGFMFYTSTPAFSSSNFTLGVPRLQQTPLPEYATNIRITFPMLYQQFYPTTPSLPRTVWPFKVGPPALTIGIIEQSRGSLNICLVNKCQS